MHVNKTKRNGREIRAKFLPVFKNNNNILERSFSKEAQDSVEFK